MTATPPAPGRRPHPVPDFFAGVATLGRGFGYWRRRPGVMALGLIPAAIVFTALAVLVGLLVASLDPVTLFLTGFATEWDAGWRAALRIAIGLALVIGLVVLAAYTFTALTLMVGDWFYGRIWRAVEDDLGGFASDRPEPGFWRANADAARLVVRAILTGLLLVAIGLVPVVGTAAAAVLGVFLSGRIVALELTTRPLAARGLTRQERRATLTPHRARVLGFGVAVQLCFFVPGGAIIVMPAAVAGSTVLARHALGEPQGG
jgi:CysZ protein